MPIFRALLALLLAVPSFAQIRGVPRFAAPLFGAPNAPILSQLAALELQKDADRLYASLARVHARELGGDARAELIPAKQSVRDDLRSVLNQLPPAPADWSELAAQLKDLRARRKALEDSGAAGSHRRAELNGKIYALQLHAAWAQLMGKAPVAAPALRRNAALWSLVGAYNSAAAAGAEAGWREGLDQAEALFGDGRVVVVSGRWRNVHSELEDAARDARNGRQADAAGKLAELADRLHRAPVKDAALLARHRQAAAALHAAAAAALSGEDGGAVSARTLAVKDLLPHPNLAEPTAVAYDDAGAAARAQLHALDSAKEEYLAVLAREAALTRWATVLAGPRPTREDRAAARAALSATGDWARRGFVGPKKIAAQNLDAALAALARGDDALAARHAALARDELTSRRAELLDVAEGLRRRLARLVRLTGA